MNKKIASALTAGSLILYSALPVLATTTIEVTGNGSESTNYANVSQETETEVDQNNDADVYNNVEAESETGENSASFNTGGDVAVGTGDAKTDVSVDNVLNSNSASVDCCDVQDAEVLIDGNGAKSNNNVELETETKNEIDQENDADVYNDVESEAETGENEAFFNTGGDVAIGTGDANADVSVSTTANWNSAVIGGDDDSDSSLSLRILNNGADTNNWIKAEIEKKNEIDQDNDADVDNEVESEAETGENEASFNTGGEVLIGTGDASTDVVVDNLVNFNHADINCGCVSDVLAKIAGNGFDSLNGIEAELESKQEIDQENDADLDNDVEADSETGENEVEKNTGDDKDADPLVSTGDASSDVHVSNTANMNTVGELDLGDIDWPFGDTDFDFEFDFSGFLGLFGLGL